MTNINNYEALVESLYLVLIAPDDKEEEMQNLLEMAEGFASTLDSVSVERAKNEADKNASQYYGIKYEQ